MTEESVIVGASDGKLLVASTCAEFVERYSVRCGDRYIPFTRSAFDVGSLLGGVNLLAPDREGERSARWHVPDQEGVSLIRDLNREWLVGNDHTWTLAAPSTARRIVAAYSDPVLGEALPVQAGSVYELSARFGSQQATGKLRLVALDVDGRVLGFGEKPISTTHRGGTEQSAFQESVVRLQMPAGAATARVEIELTKHVPDRIASSDTSFIFFAQSALTPTPDRSSQWKPLSASVPILMQLAAGVGRAAIYEAPLELGVGSEVSQAELVTMDGSDDAPAAKFELPGLGEAEASILGFSGNAVKMRVKGYAGALALYIDGRRAGETNPVRPKKAEDFRRASVVVAEEFCDGNPHLIELRDITGTYVLARGAEVLPQVLTPWAALQTYSSHPLPYEMAPAAKARYRALCAQIDQLAREGTDVHPDTVLRLSQLSRIHDILEVGFDKLKTFPPLHFPEVAEPKVSVVIPAHNKFNVTYYCLAALLFAANEASFEVVVVDDGSSDEHLQLQEIAPNVRVVRNESAQGFVRACNRGVSIARGEYVVLLNNDTEPTVGWLDELLDAFDLFENVGMAGSKLLYPDGRLQEAGGIVWSSGNPWNYGRGANPQDPRFSYARQADYLSGAALMMPRKVWDEVGGLSDEFAPAYFEDTDLAFKVRQHGYTTWLIPSSEVYHFEGLSNGTDVKTTSGLKRFQEVNRPKFKRKWAPAVVNNGNEGQDPDLVKDRGIVGRALFIDHGVPRPDRDAGSYAAIQEMRLVQSLGYKVTFAAINVAYMGHYSSDLNKMGIETIHAPFALSINDILTQRGREFDVVYITRYNVANDVLGSVREHAPQAKVLFCNADLHFLREMRAAQRDGDEAKWNKSLEIRDTELRIMRDVDVVLSYNEVEHSVILSHNGTTSNVVTCPWVVDEVPDENIPPFEAREGVAFLGGYLHPPNAEAVDFFVEQVLPELSERLPGVQFNIYGSNMPDRLFQLEDDVVNPVGYVESVEEVYYNNRIFVAPLLTGAGIKGKVLGALSYGIPSVLSPVAAESTGVRDGHDCAIAETPEEWVEAVANLYKDAEAWSRMSESARQFTGKQYSFARGRELMRKAFTEAGIYQLKP